MSIASEISTLTQQLKNKDSMPNIDKVTLKGTGYTIVDSTVPSWAKQSTKPSYTASEISGLQDTLISGTNIKTINNQSLLGSGNITPEQLNIPDSVKVGSVAGKLYRNDVNGSGNFTVKGNSGCIPNLTAGTFLVSIYAKSTTQSYTFKFNFGSVTYNLSTTNGEINDVRQITIPSSGTFSGSVLNGSVAQGTILYVVMYNYLTPISTVGLAAVTNRYSDLDGTPTIPTVPSPATATPKMDGTAAVGSSSKYAREDHVHPSDTSRMSTSHPANSITSVMITEWNNKPSIDIINDNGSEYTLDSTWLNSL